MNIEAIKNSIDHRKSRNAVIVLLIGIALGVFLSGFFLVLAIALYIFMSLDAIDFQKLNNPKMKYGKK